MTSFKISNNIFKIKRIIMKYLLIIILSTILIISCSDNSTNEVNSSKEILPLKVGNFWTYSRQKFSSYKRDSVTFVDTVNYSVSSSINLNGENWFFMKFNSMVDEYIYTNRKDGLWCLYAKDTNNIDLPSAKLFLKFPTKNNDTTTIDSGTYKTINVDEYLSTQAGIFDCIKYSKIEFERVKNCGLYYSPNVGKVMTEEIFDLKYHDRVWDTTFLQSTLIKYKVK